MGDASGKEIFLAILYATGAATLLVAAYLAYIKRYKRAKLEAISIVELITSRENHFWTKTQFLLILPQQKHVKLSLLNSDETLVRVLLDDEFPEGEHAFDFDPSTEEAGKYYISLESTDTNILRRISIGREQKTD